MKQPIIIQVQHGSSASRTFGDRPVHTSITLYVRIGDRSYWVYMYYVPCGRAELLDASSHGTAELGEKCDLKENSQTNLVHKPEEAKV